MRLLTLNQWLEVRFLHGSFNQTLADRQRSAFSLAENQTDSRRIAIELLLMEPLEADRDRTRLLWQLTALAGQKGVGIERESARFRRIDSARSESVRIKNGLVALPAGVLLPNQIIHCRLHPSSSR